MPDRKTLIRWLSFTAYFVAVFLLFILLLFPYDRVKSKIEHEVHQRTFLDLSVARISPRFINRFVLTDVVVSDQDKGTVLFESPSVTTSLSLFGLVRGIISLNLKAAAYGGEVAVKMQQGSGRQTFMLDADGLDLGAYPLFKTLGVKLTGKLGGNVEMSGASGSGRLWVKGLTTRDLKVQGIAVPDLDFEQCWIDADIRKDRLTIKKLELNGKDLKVRCRGDVVLRNRGSINLTVKLKPSERLAHEQAAILSLLKNKDAEGYYQFFLGGTLAQPLPRL